METEEFKLIEGEATHCLARLIPVENLRTYFCLYKNMAKRNIRNSPNIPAKAITTVSRALKLFKQDEWLSDKEAIEIMEYVLVKITRHNNGYNMLRLAAKVNLNKRGQPKDHALDFIIYALIYDLKYYVKKPYYKIVVDVLNEQKVLDNKIGITEDEIRKRFKRLKLYEVVKIIYCYLIENPDTITNSLQEPGFYSGFLKTAMEGITGKSYS